METALNKPPRRISETTECKCSACGSVTYSETHIADLRDDGSVVHRRVVCGQFRQATDGSGEPIGPISPFCNCKEQAHAQG